MNYGGLDGLIDRAYGIAIAPDGTIYVAGQEETSAAGIDSLILKLAQ
jgi:hypothetical protein